MPIKRPIAFQVRPTPEGYTYNVYADAVYAGPNTQEGREIARTWVETTRELMVETLELGGWSEGGSSTEYLTSYFDMTANIVSGAETQGVYWNIVRDQAVERVERAITIPQDLYTRAQIQRPLQVADSFVARALRAKAIRRLRFAPIVTLP